MAVPWGQGNPLRFPAGTLTTAQVYRSQATSSPHSQEPSGFSLLKGSLAISLFLFSNSDSPEAGQLRRRP